MIDQQIVERIHNAAHIVDVVQDYLTLKRAGQNYVACCPFHHEKTPSFTVSPAKNIFKCFSCSVAGNPVTFIMEYEKVSYADALKILAKKYNIPIVEKELTQEEIAKKNERENMFVVLEYAALYFAEMLHHHKEGINVGKSYFEERGFTDDILQKFQLGYSLNVSDEFTKTAIAKGHKEEYLIKTGLTIARENGQLIDRFWGRVIFPIHSVSGRVIGFGARTLRTDKHIAKYLNSPESDIYHKSNTLFGLFFAKKNIVQENKCFLVEGYTDVLSFFQSGIENVVASSGTALTLQQIEQIQRFTDNVTIIYDGDSAGIKASFRGIDMLFEQGLNVRVVPLPDGDDPDSLSKKLTPEQLRQYIAEHEEEFIQFKIRLLLPDASDAIKRSELIQSIVESIALVKNSITRSLYVQNSSILLSVPENVLLAEVEKIRKTKLTSAAKHKEKLPLVTHQTLPEPHHSVPSEGDKYLKEVETLEKELITYLLRYGNVEVFENQTVSEFIISEILGEELTFVNATCQKIFEEYLKTSTEKGIVDIQIFSQHHDPDIAAFTANLFAEKYTPSSMWVVKKNSDIEDAAIADKAMLIYKRNILIQTIEKLNRQLMTATGEGEIRELLTKIDYLNKYKVEFNKLIGRVIG